MSTIAEKLKGREVTLFVKQRGKDDLIRRTGTVERINPLRTLLLSGTDAGHNVFCGVSEGIVRMEGEDGGVLYQHDGVLGEYSRSRGLHHEIDSILLPSKRAKKIDEAYDGLRQQGRFYLS